MANKSSHIEKVVRAAQNTHTGQALMHSHRKEMKLTDSNKDLRTGGNRSHLEYRCVQTQPVDATWHPCSQIRNKNQN